MTWFASLTIADVRVHVPPLKTGRGIEWQVTFRDGAQVRVYVAGRGHRP